MFQIKVYKYDSTQEANGYRGQEFSGAILQGCETKEDITQELDTAEITLCGQTFREEFLPQTKFIVDFIEQEGVEPITSHWVVQKDMVEQPIMSDDNYFDHHISLIEPSVVAQQRLVDNIAVTYKLKDVSLDEKVTFDLTKQAHTFFREATPLSTNEQFGYHNGEWRWGKYFKISGDIKIIQQGGTENSDYYVNTSNGTSVKFVLPQLQLYAGLEGTKNYGYIGNVSLDYVIEESPSFDETLITNRWDGEIIENNALGTRYTPNDLIPVGFRYNECMLEKIAEQISPLPVVDVSSSACYYKQYTDTSANTPNYETQTITIRNGYTYKITISIHNFPAISMNGMSPYIDDNPTQFVMLKYGRLGTSGFYMYYIRPETLSRLNDENTSAYSSYFAYATSDKKILLCSSIPYSALALLQKAIINSNIYAKQDGVYIADVNNSNVPFIIDTNYVDKLSATSIVENFYNQKNLWEIMLDVGHYIHAIPELKFGADDKFLITFNDLGRTDQKDNLGTRVSIFNSRGVEDYISSTSSYVTNMVQLGGEIQEWVAPKTSSEDLLVYNDTAEIHTSKPIIELLEIRVKKIANNNDQGIAPNTEADITEYIYEKNVYSLLSLQYLIVPNRGIAMYYELGTNKIVGGDYQLPQANPNIFTDYAIKKIIYSAFRGYPTSFEGQIPSTGYWKDLKVNDFIFYVRYRTKDDVRQVHSRPDLRKYLLNSKYDKFPEHNQFNNQTDVLVDSEKFGNNLFGKLIKTGNSTYEITEWHNAFETLKHKGELYKINGELYYVAKVTHYWYVSHIISHVVFSKDYNELSAVIGIPSEPRFYEISEQSSIKRDISINDYILLTDTNSQLVGTRESDTTNLISLSVITHLVLDEITNFTGYALTVFKGDKDIDVYNQTTGQRNNYKEVLTPFNFYSSGNTLTCEWDMEDNYSAGNMIIDTEKPSSATNGSYKSLMGVNYTDTYGKSALFDFFLTRDISYILSGNKATTLPISPIITHNVTILSGVMTTEPTQENLTAYSKNVKGNIPPTDYDRVNVQYNNVYSNYVFLNGYWIEKPVEISSVYLNDIIFASNVSRSMLNDTNYNSRGLSLLKDNREAISFNYNLQLLTSSDTFVVSPFVFKPNKKNLRIVFLNEEVNKLADGYISTTTIIQDLVRVSGGGVYWYTTYAPVDYASLGGGGVSKCYINLQTLKDRISDDYATGSNGKQKIKAIAIVYNVNEEETPLLTDTNTPYIVNKLPFVIARNIPEDWTKDDIFKNWYLGVPIKDAVFTKKQ